MTELITFPGKVAWAGENPGIMLRNGDDGPFTGLASFFRVVLSPHGRGHVLILLQSPGEAEAAEGRNVCITDNEALAQYLIRDFVTYFGSFKSLAGLPTAKMVPLHSVVTSGDARTSYKETITGGGITVALCWRGLGQPFFFLSPPSGVATGRHHMPSVFVGCDEAHITVNGHRLQGRPIPRETAGRKHTSAFLAFSEAWIDG